MTAISNLARLCASAALVLGVGTGPVLANGGDDHHAGDFDFGAPGNPAEVDRTVTVTAENFAFSHDEIAVAAGETVRFVVRNKGNMRHDFTIGPAEVQKQHRQEMREMMGEAGMDHSDPNAVMLEPGESAELIWRFDDVQSVMFGCNVPGHFDRMNGQFMSQG